MKIQHKKDKLQKAAPYKYEYVEQLEERICAIVIVIVTSLCCNYLRMLIKRSR